MNSGRGMGDECADVVLQGSAPALEEASAIYLMIVHPSWGLSCQMRVLEGLGDLRRCPLLYSAGIFCPPLKFFVIRVSVLDSCDFFSHRMLTDSVQREEEGRRPSNHLGVDQRGRRFGRFSSTGALPALGFCGGGEHMQAAFWAPIQAKMPNFNDVQLPEV